jgi:UDP-N-acetylmuramoylalanine--D-glutamate ligase
MNLAGKNVVVVGLGKSGLAAARLLGESGATVVLNDKKTLEELGPQGLAALALVKSAGSITLSLGGHPSAIFSAADLIVLSPGVPVLPEVTAARARGAKVWSEVELASRFIQSPIVGITGSNGKSTVTTLVGLMAQRGPRPVFVGGNLGDALTLAVGTDAAKAGGLVVAELSSFQLEDIEAFRCDVAACLNVTDDHLDRHGTFAAYAAAKGRIFQNQRRTDHAVVPAGDELCLSLARAGAAQLHTFWNGPDSKGEGEVRVEQGLIVDPENGLRFPVAELPILGLHNQANACAAALMARLSGIPVADIEATLASFRGLPHRMVRVRVLEGVSYFDDSKATNVGAAVAALDGLSGLPGKVILIAGGVDKGGSYGPLEDRLKNLGRAVVLIGTAASLIRGALSGAGLPLVDAGSMEEAVSAARSLAKAGDAVLLAPACASFDMFQGYAHRGDVFAAAVNALQEGGAS